MSGVAAEQPHSLLWLGPLRSDCSFAEVWQHLTGVCLVTCRALADQMYATIAG